MWPLLVAGVVVIIGFIALWVVFQRRRQRSAVLFCDAELLDTVAPRLSWRRHIMAVTAVVTMLLLTLAAARPEVVAAVQNERTQVVLVVDVSGSMGADDVIPTRMVALQQAARDFVAAAPIGVEIGLVIFSDAAEPLVPPTSNKQVVNDAIDTLSPLGGTAVGEGLLVGMGLLETDGWTTVDDVSIQRRSGTLVLMTDGETNSGRDPLRAAEQALVAGVRVDAIAFGTPNGQVDGQVVGVATEELQQVAEIAQGSFSQATTAAELSALFTNLAYGISTDLRYDSLSHWFALAGLLVLALGAALAWWTTGRLP